MKVETRDTVVMFSSSSNLVSSKGFIQFTESFSMLEVFLNFTGTSV